MKSRPAPIEAVLFDFDGTLAVLRIDFGLMRRRVEALVEDWAPQFASDQTAGGGARERWTLELIEEVSAHLQASDPDRSRAFRSAALTTVETVELEAARDSRWLTGAPEALRQLRRNALRVGVVTRNCRQAVETVAGPAADWCDGLFTREEVGRVKPDPEHLWFALRSLGARSAAALMIGDHASDMRVARVAGLDALGVLTGNSTRDELLAAGAREVLDTVAQLPAWLHLAGGDGSRPH